MHRLDEGDAQLAREWQTHDVERIERAYQHDTAQKRRRDIVRVPAGNRGFRVQRSQEQRGLVEWRAEERIHRDGARHGGCRAAPLTAGEGQSLLCPHNEATLWSRSRSIEHG